jgi:OFA family oxalate/formate antiporter-like MFS transporter
MKPLSSYRYFILVAAVAMQMCLGATYSWAVFVEPLRTFFGRNQAAAQLPYTLFYVVFPLTVAGSGYLLERLGTRLAAVVGAVLFGCGWIWAGTVGRTSLSQVAVGIGGISGIGAGVAYVIPIATCMLWFPRHKGLVAGIAVAGFGGGSAVVSCLATHLMECHRFSPHDVFRTLGIVFLVLAGVSASIFQNPSDVETPEKVHLPLRPILGGRIFQLLYLAMFAGLCAGLAVNANLKHLLPGATSHMGAAAVSSFAISNAIGRIAWGWVHDNTRDALAIKLNLLAQMILLFLAPFLLRSEWALYGFAAIAGLNYGGVLVLYASQVSAIWSPARLPKIYGVLFTSNVAASGAPMLAGCLYDYSGFFTVAFSLIGLILVFAVILIHFAFSARRA